MKPYLTFLFSICLFVQCYQTTINLSPILLAKESGLLPILQEKNWQKVTKKVPPLFIIDSSGVVFSILHSWNKHKDNHILASLVTDPDRQIIAIELDIAATAMAQTSIIDVYPKVVEYFVQQHGKCEKEDASFYWKKDSINVYLSPLNYVQNLDQTYFTIKIKNTQSDFSIH